MFPEDLLTPTVCAKLIDISDLGQWREEFKGSLVVTNGCFDLIHAGHTSYLTRARKLGDALLVGINDDMSVTLLKGKGRPVNHEQDRAAVLMALEAVSFVCIFPGTKATNFLRASAPNVWVKGGDYTIESLNSQEKEVVTLGGGSIKLLPITRNVSTTSILDRANSVF